MMPREGATRTCTHRGCVGIQTFHLRSDIPSIGIETEDPEVPDRHPEPPAAWICERDESHCEIVHEPRHHHAMR